MKKLTDQELDALFKEAADKNEQPFDSSSWESMSTKLDAAPNKLFWKRWMTFSALGLIIFGIGVWVGSGLSDASHYNTSNEILIQSESVKADEKLSDMVVKKTEMHESKILKSDELTEGSLSSSVGFNKKEVDATEAVTLSTIKTELTSPLSIKDDITIIQPDDKFENNAIQDVENEGLLFDIKNRSIREDTITSTEVNSIIGISVDQDQELIKKQVPDTALVIERVNVKDGNEEVRRKPVFIRALVSPDFSAIGFKSTSLIGTNYSIVLEYPLNNKFSISTGAILSKKVYASNEEIIYGRFKADGVDGTCRVLDVPINLQYSIYGRKRFSLNTTFGISSYLMLSEDYTFVVKTTSGTNEYDWSFRGENNEWLKLLNVSFTAQYKVKERLFIQAEPFIKAPLSGVGEWDINLSSWGVFLGLKYQLNK